MSDPWTFGWTQLLTIVGFIITICIAVGGFRTFGRWKREKIEEKKIEIAFEALAFEGMAPLLRFSDLMSRFSTPTLFLLDRARMRRCERVLIQATRFTGSGALAQPPQR